MKHVRMMFAVALCLFLSACDVPDTAVENGAVTLKDNVVTLHADNAPNAMINAQGQLQIGDKAIATTPSQQGLLMLYYQSIADIHDSGVQMGKLGAGMGLTALKGKLNGKSQQEMDSDASKGGQSMSALAKKICQDQINMKTVQDQLAGQLPDFKPYSKIFDDDNTKCDDDK
jgi:hypothetical protein